MDISAIALQGLDAAQAQLETAAAGIASAAASGGANDTVTLSTEVVALLSAKNLASVDIATLKVAGQTQKSLVDLLA